MQSREVWSFFSGAMGLDLGLEQAGLPATLTVEIDKWCCETIRLNKPSLTLIEGDVRELTADSLRKHRNFYDEVFLVVGGPPCQTFSPGGKRAALSDPRGNLICEFFRVVKEIRPKFFIFENVANITTAAISHRPIKDRPGKHWSLKKYESLKTGDADDVPALTPDEMSGSAFKHLLEDIKSLQYHFNFGILDAADYGAAQHRLRFIMIGSKEDTILNLPTPTHGSSNSSYFSYKTLRDAIGDFREDPGPHAVYTPKMSQYFELVPEGGNWRHLPEELQAEAMGGSFYSGGGKTGFYRRLSWDAPSPTITGRANRKGSAICHPEFTRPLSVRECARIQGFPDRWYFAGSMSQQYLQIGNAVPIQLGRAIGRTILQIDTHPKEPLLSCSKSSPEQMFLSSVSKLRASAKNKLVTKVVQQRLFETENKNMINYIPAEHPLQSINNEIKNRLCQAQSNLLHLNFASAGELLEKAFSDLRISCSLAGELYDHSLSTLTNKTYGELFSTFEIILTNAGFPDQSIAHHATNLAQRMQLIQAFEKPDEVVAFVEDKVADIVSNFPRRAEDIERGRNPGDVIDPYIIAASRYLLYNGDFDKAIEATIAHKALMMIEGLLGHLHEDVIGLMRGNVRTPEPRGKSQDKLDPDSNPFPGADLIQPPWSSNQPLKFYQLKSKTGSAKGGDGIRLGTQLRKLQECYGGEIYYAALIGTTLDGHRSKAAVEREAPKVTVLVGDASFRELTGSEMGSQLLLRVYQTAFVEVARKSGYVLETIASGIVSTFTEQAREAGDGYLETILRGVTEGPVESQDSRLYNQQERKSRKRRTT